MARVNGTLHAIDCDVHPTVPDMKALLPYLDDFWRETVEERGINSLETVAYPPNAPLTARPEWRGKNGRAAADASSSRRRCATAGRRRSRSATASTAWASLFSEDMAAAFTRALNDWVAREWLDRDPRLRASIVLPMQNTEYAVDEIERCAKDHASCKFWCWRCRKRRSAGVTCGRSMPPPNATACRSASMPARPTAMPLPRWAGRATTSRIMPATRRPSSRRWRAWSARACSPSFPRSRWCCSNPASRWLPGFLWRFAKFWRGVRSEVPWVDRSPAEIVRDHVRLTIQPFDAPADPTQVERVIDHLRSDAILLYASDFPHWQFDGDETVPAGHSRRLAPQDHGRESRSRPISPACRSTRDEYRGEAARARRQNSPSARRHLRLRHPSQELARGPASLSQQSLVGLSADLWPAPAPRLCQGLSLSQEPAAGIAARLLAARRRPAGKRSRLHAPAAPRLLRHRMGHHESALANRAGRTERRAQRRDGVRRQ